MAELEMSKGRRVTLPESECSDLGHLPGAGAWSLFVQGRVAGGQCQITAEGSLRE